MNHAHRSFTLLELLIVVAIIAVLAAILLPALKRAKDQARTSACLNNLKQLAVAFELYRSDYDDWLPGDSDGVCPWIWPHRLNAYLRVADPVVRSHSTRNPFVCPAKPLTDADQFTSQPWDNPNLSYTTQFWINCGSGERCYYSMNSLLGLYPSSGDPFEWKKSIRSPSRTAMYLDGFDDQATYAFPYWRARHAGRVNFVFCDGHTESWDESKIPYGGSEINNPIWNPKY